MQRLKRWIGGAIAFGLIGAAVLLTALRLALPFAAEYRAALEERIAGYLDTPVSIGAMEVEWHGLGPRLRLIDLRLTGPAPARMPVHFEEAYVDLGLAFGGERALPVRIRSMALAGLDLQVRLDGQGRLSLLGARVPAEELVPRGDPPPAFVRRVAAWLLGTERLQLLDASIDIVGPEGRHSVFSEVDLQLVNGEAGRHRAELTLDLPERWGGTLNAVLDVTGREFGEWDAWSGRVWVKGTGIDLARFSSLYPNAPLRVRDGQAGFSAWLDFGRGEIDEIMLLGDTEGLALESAATEQPVRFDHLGGRLRWQRDGPGAWQLDVGDLEVRREGRAWPTAALSIARAPADGRAHWRVGASFLRLEDILALARLRSKSTESVRSLRSLAPHGDLHQLRAAGTGPERFGLKARFEDLGWSAADAVPGVAGLDGGLRAGADRATIEFDTRRASIDAPSVMAAPLPVAEAAGTVTVERAQSGYRVHGRGLELRNADGHGSADLSIAAPDGGPVRLDIRADFADISLPAVTRYLPARLIPDKVMAGLERTLQDGRITKGSLRLAGDAADFPYRDGSGTFTVDLAVRDATIDFAPRWPALKDVSGTARFEGPALTMVADTGRMFGITARRLRARIPDLGEGNLEVRTEADAPLGDLLRLIDQSPLAAELGGFFAGARATGNAPLQLDLQVPLRDAEDTRVDGRLALDDDALVQPRLGLDLRELSGDLHFSRRGIASEGISATVRGRRLQLTAGFEGEEDPLNVITARGEFGLTDLLPDLPESVARHFGGRAPWDIEVRIPSAREAPIRVVGVSDLRGMTVDLPAPLGKPAQVQRRFSFSLPLTGDGGERSLRIDYGETLRGLAHLEDTDGDMAVRRATLRFGEGGGLRLRDRPGVYLAGRLEALDLKGWAGVVLGGDDGVGERIGFAGADLAVANARYAGHRLSGLRLEAGRTADGWSIDLVSNEMDGSVRVPPDAGEGAPIRARFDWIDTGLMAPAASPGSDEDPGATLDGIDPGTLPPLDLRIERLKMRSGTLRRVALVTGPAQGALTIHRLEFTNDALRMEGQGRWRGGAEPKTSLRLQFRSDNFGAGLADIGYGGALVEGEGKVTADLDWPGAPWSPTLEGLGGHLEIDLADGVIPEVDPGPARLLGLLSLRALPQLLTLDFRGLVESGYAFESIEGRIDFADGNAYSRNLEVEGPVGTMIIGGRTGLVAQDYDQTIRFQPQLSSSLPLIGALSGGPVTGLAVALIQGVLRNVGADVEKASEIRYTLTGPWGDPKVQRVSATPEPASSDASDRSGRQRP